MHCTAVANNVLLWRQFSRSSNQQRRAIKLAVDQAGSEIMQQLLREKEDGLRKETRH